MAREIEYREDKLTELTLYVAVRCQRHRHFGRTKLNKILFYADFIAYKRRGTPITGAKYKRGEFGPLPVEIGHVRQKLIAEHRAIEQEVSVTPAEEFVEKRLLALKPADLGNFNGEDIAIVDEVIDEFRSLTGTALSEMSHALPGWLLARDGEEIPYFTALAPKEGAPLSPRDEQRASEVAERYFARKASNR